MRMNKARLKPHKPEVPVVGPDSMLGSDCTVMLDGAPLPWKDQVRSWGVLRDLALLLDK